MDSTNSINLLHRLTPLSLIQNTQSPAHTSNKNSTLPNMQKLPSFQFSQSNSLSPKKNIGVRSRQRFNTELPLSDNRSQQLLKPSASSISPDKTVSNHPPLQRNYTIEKLSTKIQENIFRENMKERNKLNNILKVSQDGVSKVPKEMDQNDKQSSQKIADRIDKVFQKKEIITTRQMPSAKHSNVNSLAASPQNFKIRNLYSLDSPVKAKMDESAKKWPDNGTTTLRESALDVSSFGYLAGKTQKEMQKSKLEPLALSQIGPVSTTKPKPILNGWSSGRVPETKFDFDFSEVHSQLISPKNNYLETIQEDIKSKDLKEIRVTSKVFTGRSFKIPGDYRDKLNEIIKKKSVGLYDGPDAATFAEIPIDPNSNANYTDRISSHDRNTLQEAMQEYEKSFHERFGEIRKGYSALKQSYFPSRKPLTEEKKWARELPSRKAFTIAPTDNIVYEAVKPGYSRSRKIAQTQIVRTETNRNRIEEEEDDSENSRVVLKQAKIKRLRAAIRTLLMKYANLRITITELLNNSNIFPEKYYEKEHAERFIKAAKTGDITEIKQILLISKYYVYEFDPVIFFLLLKKFLTHNN